MTKKRRKKVLRLVRVSLQTKTKFYYTPRRILEMQPQDSPPSTRLSLDRDRRRSINHQAPATVRWALPSETPTWTSLCDMVDSLPTVSKTNGVSVLQDLNWSARLTAAADQVLAPVRLWALNCTG